METVDIVRSEAGRVKEDSPVSQLNSADPVIYQLVRVDGNGRLVPATEEEILAVGKREECNTANACGSDKIQLMGSEGLRKLEDVGTDAEKPNVPSDPGEGSEKISVQLEEKIPPSLPTEREGRHGRSGIPEGCSKPSGGFDKNGPSNSVVRASAKPNFSLLKGEICLDDLSVKELQEIFWATFGRETSVKDKLWLKRRIGMGLTNSCDFSTTSFEFREDGSVQKGQHKAHKSEGDGVLFDCIVETASETLEKSSSSGDKRDAICSTAKDTKLESPSIVGDFGNKDAGTEQRPAKRVRKPTRRYIEELSEEESKDSVRQPASDQPCARVSEKSPPNLGLDGRCLTRKDSIGGSGVQVPYVSRIRRSRPRENFMTFMKLQPSGMGMSTRPLNNRAALNEELDGKTKSKILKPSLSTRWIQELPVASTGIYKPYPERKNIQMENEKGLENMESCKDDSDDEVVTVATIHGGMRRKHHRPWTLTEVVKLVEGVAKYGVGRWSEIKRVSFASYSYRTSVDLKDKWRNLLKASLAELPAGNGVHCSRKPGSVPIPATILSRVRELAHMQTPVPPRLNSSKVPERGDSTRSVHESRSGFL